MRKTILVTGASGLIGSKLVKELFVLGYLVVVVTRNIIRAKKKLPYPIEFVLWEDLETKLLQKVDGVFHLAGENIAEHRWSKKQKDKIYNSRIVTTKKLVEFFSNGKKTIDFFCSASAVGYYGFGDHPKTEQAPAGNDFLALVCKHWEYEAQKIQAKRKIIARLGVVLDANGGALQKILPFFRIGFGGRLGLSKIWMSWITSDDVIYFFLQALQKKWYEGVYNLVCPEPITNAELTKKLAKIYQLPALFIIPRFVLKLIFGSMSQIILGSQKVYPQRLLHIDHSFCYPSIDKALAKVCSVLPIKKKKQAHFCFQNYQFLPLPVEKVFPFFCDAKNLSKITPDFLAFKNLTYSSKNIEKNTLIQFQLKTYKIPIKWKIIIRDFESNKFFSDLQLQGPYQIWFHQHFFYPIKMGEKQGVLLEDRIFYRLPLMPFSLVMLAFIKNNLVKIFTYRNKIIQKTNF